MSTHVKTEGNELATTNTSLLTMSSSGSNNNTNTEQPQTKRQKIEKIIPNYKNTKAVKSTTTTSRKSHPPDVIDPAELVNRINGKLLSSLCSSSHSISPPSFTNNSETSTPSRSRATSLSQLLHEQNIINVLPSVVPAVATFSAAGDVEIGVDCSVGSSGEHTADEVDRIILPNLLSVNTNAKTNKLKLKQLFGAEGESNASQDMREFEESLTNQCLCGVTEHTLRKSFQSHYSLDSTGQKRIANLNEWPTNKLLQFLSNLQLLFNIYLKQNSKGFICGRIMDVCDALIRNDHNLIDEIIVLAACNNAYVQFLAGRVLASFLVIAKQEMNDDWLKKLVENFFNFVRLDQVAVQKMHFSLEIIKRIVEWKDMDLHPLEDEIEDMRENTANSDAAERAASAVAISVGPERHTYLHFQTQQHTLETNYFAVRFQNDGVTPPSEENLYHLDAENGQAHNNRYNLSEIPHLTIPDLPETLRSHRSDVHSNFLPNNPELTAYVYNGAANVYSSTSFMSACRIVTLTDSDSFDTTHLKCITIKILENKWPALVKNMSALIANHIDVENAENCIINFLQLWENIISVKANLSIVETLPFYAQLDKFEILLNQNLSCTIYKQMLSLFNEALCYGSTLALQDMLPDETCQLAHQIVRHVKDFRILESLPRRQPENIVSMIGFKKKPVIYEDGTFHSHCTTHTSSSLVGGDAIEMDKTILQKMVLLVLKSIAVTVKEIRSDTSDSSVDSADYDAFQDMVLIERSIRDVLYKLETFIKLTLEFHPECHFSKILIHLFDDQDDHLIEAMVCTLDVSAGISFRKNAFPELVSMLNPIYTFLEFLKMISNSSDLLLDLLVSNETCFLLYLLRFLKYIRLNWTIFVQSCHDFGIGISMLDEAMSVLIRLRLQISRLVSRQLYPYDISPVLRLLESCESLYEGNELS